MNTTSTQAAGDGTATTGAKGRVGISLMASGDTEAAIEYLRETQPDATVDFRDCFYKIERSGLLSFDMAQISELAGRDIDTDIFLVNMSTYYGRIVVGDGRIDIYSDIRPDRFKD